MKYAKKDYTPVMSRAERYKQRERKKDLLSQHSSLYTVKHKKLTINTRSLMKELEKRFPIQYQSKFMNALFPVSNESGYPEVLAQLEYMPKPTTTSAMKNAALLFGNSHFLSILPELLAENINTLIMADIDGRMHLHTQHLLACLKKSNNREEFRHHYGIDNPIVGSSCNKASGTPDVLTIDFLSYIVMTNSKYMMDNYCFMSSEKRFQECKDAAEKLTIVPIHLDVTNKKDCGDLASILEKNNTQIKLCNLTNIHEYVSKTTLRESLSSLLSKSNDCMLMYSVGFNSLRTRLSQSKDDYFSKCVEFPSEKQNTSLITKGIFAKTPIDISCFNTVNQNNSMSCAI